MCSIKPLPSNGLIYNQSVFHGHAPGIGVDIRFAVFGCGRSIPKGNYHIAVSINAPHSGHYFHAQSFVDWRYDFLQELLAAGVGFGNGTTAGNRPFHSLSQ
jgi:hypothetical protein